MRRFSPIWSGLCTFKFSCLNDFFVKFSVSVVKTTYELLDVGAHYEIRNTCWLAVAFELVTGDQKDSNLSPGVVVHRLDGERHLQTHRKCT